jgi:Phospholipase B
LEIITNPNHRDIHQAYTAGFGEGLITNYLIGLHFHNTVEGRCSEPLSAECQKLKNFVDINAAWIQRNIDESADTDPYWHQASFAVTI